MSELGKPFPKNQIKKFKKLKINVKMPHVNKKTTSEKDKFGSNKKLGLEWTMNGLEKLFTKQIQSKNWNKQ